MARRLYAGAVLMWALAPCPFALADGSGPMEPFPITGAYSAFHREDRDHISIIEIGGNYDKSLGNGAPNVEPRAVVAREFFRKHPDSYDFIVAFSTFEFDTGDATAFHWAVQNKVQGIGIPPFNNTTLFGSKGKLQGFVDMAALSRYKLDPLNPEFETALGVLAHEVLHQWGSFVKFKQPDGSISDALLGRSGAHWSYLLDSDGSVEYGADWKDNGDGSFTAVGIRKFFSPLDLYLMGFYKPEEVPPFFLIENPQIDKTQLPEENITITGTKRQVTINDVIAAEGPRVPAAGQAQKEFRIAFVLLTGPNQEVSDAQIAAINYVRNAFMTRFAILTGGRAVAQAFPEALPTVTDGSPTPVSGGDLRTTPASLEEGLAWLRSRQHVEGFWSDKDTTAVRDTTVVTAALASLDTAFTGAGPALQWLNQNPSTNTDYLARHARLLVELGADATPIRTQLLALQNSDGGWGIAAGYQSNPLDTALATLAVAGSATAQAALDKAAQYLLSKQNADGGWSSAPGSPSRATATTTVLRALQALGRQTAVTPAAVGWLKTKQNPDGGFGDSPSTVHDTANVLQSLIALNGLADVRADDAANYLLSRQTTAGSWEGSVYATATAVAALKRFSLPNWVVTEASAAPDSPRDGDRVKFTITVKNDANIVAPASVLRVYDGDPASGGTPIGPDLTVPILGPGAGVTFSPLWDSFGKAGVHSFVALVDPDNAQTEMSERDNRKTVNVTVQPAPSGVDLTFGTPDIAVSPAQPNRLPTTLGITVSVRNLGLTDARNVRVLLWAGAPGTGTLVGETTLDVLSRSTVVVNFSYALTKPGAVSFSAQIDPDNTIAEANETNNARSIDVALAPSVDLVVTGADISVDKNPVFLGDDVTFKIKLRNEGTVDAPSTQVRYLVTDGNSTQELRINTVQLGAGQSTEQTVVWRVNLSGSLTFTAQLDPSGLVPELDESNNVATLALSSGAASGPNLVISFQDFTFAPNPGLEGYALALSAVVRNTGNTPAVDVEVAFYNGDPAAGGTQIGATQVVALLAPGASSTVILTWPAIPDSADKLLFVVADPANRIVEFSEADNAAFNLLRVRSLPDLAISSGDIQLSPAFPKTGDSVALTVRVTNLGAQEAANVVVRAYDGDPAAGGTPIGGDQTIALISGFGSGLVSFNWTASAASGSRPIVVQVDPDNAILERTKTNNSARRDVAVQNGDLFVTEIYFSPDGDGVKDSTQLFFRLQNAATVAVQVLNKRDAVVRRFSGQSLENVTGGNVVWDGLDDLGRVVQDGGYRLRIVDGAGASLGEVGVQIDTNRSSLLEADGSKFASFSNLTCEVPDINGLTLTNDDSRAFFYISNGSSPQAVYPRGIYRMEGDGTDVRAIVPESFFNPLYNGQPVFGFPWAMSAAAGGARVAFSRADVRTSQDPHWVVDADGKNLRKLPLDQAGFNTSYWMAPSGNTLYAVPNNAPGTLLAIPVDSVGLVRTLFTVPGAGSFASIDTFTLRFSPDGKKVAFQAYDGSGLSLWVVDTATGAGVQPLGDNVYGFWSEFVWAAGSTRLAVLDRNNRIFHVVDQSGALIRTVEVPVNLPENADFFDTNLSGGRWASSGAEFAFAASITAYDRFENRISTADPGGIYVADLVTGNVVKVATFLAEDGCSECNSYHVSTWDGSKWAERGVLHYGLRYQEKTLDLSKYLPDANGLYRVRIRQLGLEAAHVESVALLSGQNRFQPASALHLRSSKDVLAPVLRPDNEVLDLFGAEMEVRWDGPIPNSGKLSLALNAREESLSKRNAVPFSYPLESDRVYEYRLEDNRPLIVDGNQTAQDGLGEPLFKTLSKPNTGHPAAVVNGFVQSDSQYLYGVLDFTVDNTLDGDKDWASLRVKTAEGWKEFKITASDARYGSVGFIRTGTVHHTHKYYEFKVPLSEIGARAGDVVSIGFQAYGTAAIIVGEEQGLRRGGDVFWVPGERSLLYHNTNMDGRLIAILLDEENRQKPVMEEWLNEFFEPVFSPTGRQLLFKSTRQAQDPASTCYQQGSWDDWSFRSLLNLTADLRAIRSAKAGGIQLKGTAADLNFSGYTLEYAAVATPTDWRPVAPASGQPVVDDLFTTWVPPGPGNYFVRLTVQDLAGNKRQTIKRVSWSDTPSITDVYRAPAIISPNGDGVQDSAIIHYRVLEPVHLTFEFFNEAGNRVRTITRDHSSSGIEVDLAWDGRDDNGLPVPDGKYRMTVQNYEFFVTVDSTPPKALIDLRGPEVIEISEAGIALVGVEPSVEFSVSDTNLTNFSIESGVGADPTQWVDQTFILKLCATGTVKNFPDRTCAKAEIFDFANHRFRLNAVDEAGNRTVITTPLAPERLVVHRFGNLGKLSRMLAFDLPGASLPVLDILVELNTVVFDLAETIRAPIAQLSVQFKKPDQTTWSESPVSGTSQVTWDMAGVLAGESYLVRLHAVDSDGGHHFSNQFSFRTEGLIFFGLFPPPGTPDPPSPVPGETILWGKEAISEPLETVRLFVRSIEDPRFATAREIGVVSYPQNVFLYRTKDLKSCIEYFGYLEARTELHRDPVTGASTFRTIRSAEQRFRLTCLDVTTRVDAVPALDCNVPPPGQAVVKFATHAFDGSELKLLTLSRPLANGGEDVLFNVNKPRSVDKRVSPDDQVYLYEYTFDTSQLPEGVHRNTLTATLINVNDQKALHDVPVQVDLTPPVARLTYPIQGQRLCGVPRQLSDGSIQNVLTFEGEITDVAGLDYTLEFGPGAAPDDFVKFHDSRNLESRNGPIIIFPPKPSFQLNSVVGPIGELRDLNGEFTARLRVVDLGGFQRCETSTFYFDGLVDGAKASLDRRLFSPNGDGQFDEVVVNYEVDEAATLDVNVHRAVIGANGNFNVVEGSLRQLQNQVAILAGASSLSWDGRDASGAVVVDGWYAIVVTFKDGCGNLQKINRFTEVDNTPPTVVVAYPRITDQLPMIVEVQGTVNDLHLQGYGVDFGVGTSPETWVRLAGRTGNTQGAQVLAPWNTFGLEGAHALRVVATDAVGNQRVVEVPVNLAARTNLISYLEAVPDLFSPNGDGRRETTALRFGLEENALVTLAIADSTGTVRRSLVANQSMGKGPVALTWDGTDNAGNPLPDDTYSVSLLAELAGNPLLKQSEKITVVLDRTAPTIEILRPASGFVPASGGIVGTVQDAHLAEYTVAITDSPASPTWETLDSGTDNRNNAVFGSLQGRAEGEYALKIDATDLGEITSSKILPFVIDNTPPKVSLTAPEKGSVVGKNKNPVTVAGTVEEKYLASYELSVGSGDAPPEWTELASGTTLSLPEVLRTWDVSALADGLYTLRLFAQDKAGNTSESRVVVAVDHTPPVVGIALPTEDGYLTKPMEIRGAANDPHFAEYKLETAPGAKGTSTRWSEIGAGVQAVSDGVLLTWEALPPDGVQTLRLTAKDKADNVAEVSVQVIVDTKPPLAPANLAAKIEDRTSARLTWTANGEPDLAGYAVYRDGVRITSSLLGEPTYLDPGLIEGRYTYAVTAFDKAGWESAKSNEAPVVVDVTPPTTRISAPGDGSTVSGLLDVKGTAYSVDDFKEYRLYVGAGATPSDYQLLRRSPVPVLADVFTQWNTVVLQEGAQFTLKLESEDINGNVGTDRVTVTIDNLPPAPPTGLVGTPNGANVQLSWNANTEADLLGYLVFRNERLANLQGVLVGSLRPYAVVTTSYPDLLLPDGPYTYYLLAVDRADNISDPSNSASVTIETRAPHATIVQPVAGTHFDQPLYVLATTPDTDVARVQFQYRAVGAATWTNLGAPDTATPYEASFDPATLGLGYDDYQLQAIATDASNKTDAAPTPVPVTYVDVTRPATTVGVVSRVNGEDVTLTWQANTDADLAGYYIDRTSDFGSTVRLTPALVTATTYLDAGLGEDTYRYVITAVDTSGNEADPSAPAVAVVYGPELTQPYTPTTETVIAISGKGIGPAIASGELENSTGITPLPAVEANAQGEFTIPNVPLAPGQNEIGVFLTDAAGNVSFANWVTVVSGSAPSKPVGLSASASDYNVTLNWTANPEPNVVGYRVFRNGQTLLPDMPMTDLFATASSWFSWAPPFFVVDFNPDTFWTPVIDGVTPPDGEFLNVSWPEPRIVTQVTLSWYYDEVRAVDFDLQAWSADASNWITVAEIRDNQTAENVITLARPYRTTQLRLLLHKSFLGADFGYPIFLSELGVMYQPLVDTNSFVDVTSDGHFEYTVSAVNEYAFESAPSDAVTLPVGDVTPPEPVTLDATVDATDVTLTWTASTSLDVVRYTVYRDGSLIATHTDLTNLLYVDAGRPNGTYVYTVKSMDNANNESVPSNEAPATVAIAPPPAPVSLAVTVVPTGGALDLTWAPGSGSSPSGFRIFRATVPGGPYETIGDSDATERRDSGLVNGLTYYYVVAALDSFGNASLRSNEASGTPLDRVAPFVELHYPGRPGRLIITDQGATSVVARAEPGARVTLTQNGVSAGQAQASVNKVVNPVALPSDAWRLEPSPDGRYIAFQNDNRQLRLYDFSSGTSATLVTVSHSDDIQPRWTPDGREVLYQERDQNFFSMYIRAYRIADGRIRDLTRPEDGDVRGATMSADGTQLAVIGYRNGEEGIWQVDLATESWTLVAQGFSWSFHQDSLGWSPDGTRVVFLRTFPSTSVETVHLATGNSQVIDDQAGFSVPSWSPDGSEILFTSVRNGMSQVWRYALLDGSSTPVTDETNQYYSPVWSPDGRAVAYVDDFELLVQDLTDGSSSVLVEARLYIDTGLLKWGASGYLGLWMDDQWLRIAPPGRVEFKGVALTPGDNVFNAVASDAAGNVSVTPGAMVVNYRIADRADLAVTDADLRIVPAAALPGETVRVTLTVRNIGALSSTTAGLSLFAISPEGAATTLIDGKVLRPIAPGGSQTLSADWAIVGATGNYSLVAIVDPLNEVLEVSEANNLALRTVRVAAAAGQSLGVTTDRILYLPGETVVATVTLDNHGDAFTGRLVVSIVDLQGFPVQTVLAKNVSGLAFGGTLQQNVSWPTGSTFAGDYRVRALLTDSGNQPVAEASASFSLGAASQFVAQVATDRAVYVANQNARVTGDYTYSGGNAVVAGAVAALRIVAESGAVLAQSSETLGELLPGASGTLALDWNSATVIPGQYRAALTLTRDGAVLASAETLFRVESSGADLGGSLTLSELAPAPGTPQTASFTVRNLGNQAFAQVPIIVSLVDPGLATPLKVQQAPHDFPVGGEAAASFVFDTTTLTLKTYTVVLQAQLPLGATTGTVTLATATFNVADRSPPSVSVRAPGENGFIRGDAKATVFALDALSAVRRVEISVDGSAWTVVPVHSAAESLYGDLLRNLPDGTHTIAARATDTWNNTGATSVLSFVVDNLAPQIVVQGVADGGGYNADVVPQVSFSDLHLDTTTLTLNGAGYVSGTPLTAEGSYRLAATAADKAGNRAVIDLSFVLDKTAPQIVIGGVQNGAVYNHDVIPTVQVTDSNPGTQTVSLNGQPFVSGTAVTAEGAYELVVTAVDRVGNQATATLNFQIDKTAPTVTITQPVDGAVLTSRVTDVRGRTEPLAEVFLTVGLYQATSTSNAQGEFAFTLVPLAEGQNEIDAYARDRAGNIGPTARVSVRVSTEQTAQLFGETMAYNGAVLVWLPGTDDTRECRVERYGDVRISAKPSPANDRYAPLAALIEASLARENADYLIVRNEVDFIAALRSRRYLTVLLAELKRGGGEPTVLGSDDEVLRMSAATGLEIRASVASGTGIVWVKTHPDNNEHMATLFGAKPNGSLPQLAAIELPNSAASVAGVWTTQGSGMRVKLIDGTPIGELKPSGDPAIVIHKYGVGRTALMTFDPAEIFDPQGAIDALANVIHYAIPTGVGALPGAIQEVRWTAAQLAPPLTVEFKEQLSEAMSFVAAAEGTIVNAREAVWERSVTANETKFGALVKLPQTKGDSIVAAQLYEKQDASLRLLAENTLVISLALGRKEFGLDVLDKLHKLSVPNKQLFRLRRAIESVQAAMARVQGSRADADYSISKLLAAFAELQDIDATGEGLVSVGKLLGVYQSLWFDFSP